MKKTLGALAIVAMITLMAPAPAEAQATGNVSVSIDLTGGILLLYYYNSVNIDINVANLVDTTGCVDGGSGEWGCSQGPALPAGGQGHVYGVGTVLVDYETPLLTPTTDLSSVQITLQDVWAVRAIGGNTSSTTVSIADGTTLTLTDGGTNSIVLSTFTVSDGVDPYGASTTFDDPGLVTAEVGNVRFLADLTNVTAVGSFIAAGTQYVLSATDL